MPSFAIVRACGAQIANRMSFVDVFPVEPGDRDDARARALAHGRPRSPASAACASSGTSAAAAPRASACSTKSAPPPTATNRSPSAMRRESICTPVTASAHGRATTPAERLDDVELDAGSRRAPRARPARSSNGTLRPASSISVSAPLPAITTTSPGRASASAVSIAARRSSTISSRPAATSAAIAAGSSERGLSVVTIARSASCGGDLVPSAAASRGRGRRRRRRRRSAPLAELARGAQHVLERVGRVRVVDDHRERLPRVDRLEPARERRRAPRCPRGSRPRRRRARAPPRSRRARSRG